MVQETYPQRGPTSVHDRSDVKVVSELTPS